jgi:hypothetical protein
VVQPYSIKDLSEKKTKKNISTQGGLQKLEALKPEENAKLSSHSQHFMKTGPSHAMHMWMSRTMKACSYDMIIGRDLMHSLGINLLFDTAEIAWDNAKIHMLPPARIDANWIDKLEQELLFAYDPTTTNAERIQSIIEATYCPADLKKIVEECNHLTNAEQRQLLK